MLWLEEYLTRWKKTLIVVSHDREFLNTVCGDIIHLHDLKLATYRGNFAQFEEMYEQRRREANKAFEKCVAERGCMRDACTFPACVRADARAHPAGTRSS